MAVLRSTQWAALEHARGRADGVVTLLRQLIDEDPDIRTAALEVLELVTHQNSIYSATAPVALYVAGILGDARTVPVIKTYPAWRDESGCLRVVLLDFLGGVAEDVGDETVGAAAGAGYRMEDDPAVTAGLLVVGVGRRAPWRRPCRPGRRSGLGPGGVCGAGA